MKRRRGRKKERRTIWILGLVFVLAAGLVAWVALRGDSGPLLPPEDPEVLALRASPENAFNVLTEACALLPEKPPERLYPVEGRSGHLGLHETEPDSVARILDMRAPDESEDVVGYLKGMEPAFEKVREALDGPVYLLPLSNESDWYAPYANDYCPGFLAKYLRAKALHVSRYEGDQARALDYLLLSARLARRIQDDGPVDAIGHGLHSLRDTLECGREILLACEDDGVLRDVAVVFLKLSRESRNLPRSLEEFIRVEDTARLRPSSASGWRGFGPGAILNASRYSMAQRRNMEFLRQEKKLLFEALSLPYPEYRQWLAEHGEFKEYIDAGYRGLLGQHVMMEVNRIIVDAAYADGLLRAVAIDIALMLHKRDKGEFPESLDALVPAYLDTMPVDPWTEGRPFVYEKVDGDYLLYSVGLNGVDDDAQKKRGMDYVFHEPPAKQGRR